MLALFRVAAAIPVPGVSQEALRNFLSNSQFLGLFNIFSGGALSNLSIVMLGVGPFITASIIMQILTMVFPALKEMYQEEGEAGRMRFNNYTRLLTIPLAFLQAYGLLVIFVRQGIIAELSLYGYLFNIIVAVAGTMMLVWIGELITEKGVGNGISLLIFAGIVSRIPAAIYQEYTQISTDPQVLPRLFAFILVSVVVIAGVVFITEGQRNIPVSYAKRIRGMRMYGGVSTHLPLRVNQAGVIPIIFAVSIIIFPGVIGTFLSGITNPVVQSIGNALLSISNSQGVMYGIIYFALVFAFTYFYTAVTFDPHSIAENLQKQGGFIPGIRPGNPTADYLARILNRITLFGAIFLGTVAVLPLIVQNVFDIQALTLGGTALLIVVSVVLETMKQIEAQLVMREYENI